MEFRRHIPLLLLLLLSVPVSGQTVYDADHNREGEESFKQERRRWIEEMRRAAPGVNVDVLDEELRRAVRMRRAGDAKGRGVAARGNGVRLTNDIVGYWSERGSRNQAGRTLAADIDFVSGRIYVAADGGQIWRATMEGEEWTPLNDPARFDGVRMLRVHRTGDRLRIVVVHGGRVTYSDSDGRDWQEATGLESLQGKGAFTRADMGDDGTIYAVGYEIEYQDEKVIVAGIVYVSSDNGTSFRRVARAASWAVDVAAPPGVDWAYLLIDKTLSIVTPDGTMETIAAPIPLVGAAAGVTEINMRSPADNVLYLQLGLINGSEFHLSLDSGRTWTKRGSNGVRLFARNSFAVSERTPAALAVGGLEVVHSGDIGGTWERVNDWTAYESDPATKLHADIPFIGYYRTPEGGEIALISTDGGLYRSDDGLKTVRNLSLSGLRASQYYSVYTARVDTTVIFAGSQDQGLQVSQSDDGAGILDFRQVRGGDYGYLSSGDGGRSLWMNYPGFSLYYPDALHIRDSSGAKGNFLVQGHDWLPQILADPEEPTVAYMAGGSAKPRSGDTALDNGARLVRMRYDGAAMRVYSEILPFDFGEGEPDVRLTALAISPVRTADRYVFTDRGTLHVSTDGGAVWRVQGSVQEDSGGQYFNASAILPSRSRRGRLYIAGSGYSNPGVWVSDDNGTTFEAMSEGLPPTMVYDIDASTDDRMLFAATEVGPYVYLADSGRWYDAGGGAPDQKWWSVDYIEENRLARFASYGRGIWDLRLVADSTSSGVEERAASAATLALTARRSGAGYAVTVNLPTSASVTLHVYDLSGRLVARLHDGALSAGSHRFAWEGTTDEGMAVPSGEYFVVAAGGGTVGYATVPVVR